MEGIQEVSLAVISTFEKHNELKPSCYSYIGSEHLVPFRGPPYWNLTKWSAQDKKLFSFGNEVDDDDM